MSDKQFKSALEMTVPIKLSLITKYTENKKREIRR